MFNGTAFLARLEDRLVQGAGRLPGTLVDRHARWVLSRQGPAGGFPARQGQADLYYTDFALRVLVLAEVDPAEAQPTCRWIESQVPDNTVDCFGLLSCRRQLARLGAAADLDDVGIVDCLRRHRRGDGSFRAVHDRGPSCYNTFLGCLCHELLDAPVDGADRLVEAIASLQRPDGGFPEDRTRAVSQTNTTGAALATMAMFGPTVPEAMTRGVAFMQSMQADGGGFRAHPGLLAGDLLSSFTALAVLSQLDLVDTVDVSAIARLTSSLSRPGGGFRSCKADLEVDIEYTYYGLGVAALLRRYADSREGELTE